MIPVLLPGGDKSSVEGFLRLPTWVEFRQGIDETDNLHRLSCGIRRVKPGPTPQPTPYPADPIIDKLRLLKQLQDDGLIHDIVALENQRLMVSQLMRLEIQYG